MRILIIASEPVDDRLIDLTAESGDPAEVRVLAPTLPESALRYWMNDNDRAIRRARRVAEQSADALAGTDGLKARPQPATDDDPAISIADALREFKPDRVVVVKHREDEEDYREDAIVDEVTEHTDAPVTVHEVHSMAE